MMRVDLKTIDLQAFVFALTLCLLSAHVKAEQATIAVASNFILPAKALVEAFKHAPQTQPGQAHKNAHELRLVSGASGKLYAQIQHGAPFDLFLSAETHMPKKLQQQGLGVANYRATYAVGQLALASATLSADVLESRLKQGEFSRVAIANPSLAPYGRASMQVLESLALDEKTQGKRITAENIAQCWQFVYTGNVDLGFVALSQLRQPQDDRTSRLSFWQVPHELHQPIQQDMLLLSRAKHNIAATAFYRFLLSADAQRIMAHYGYLSAHNDQQGQTAP